MQVQCLCSSSRSSWPFRLLAPKFPESLSRQGCLLCLSCFLKTHNTHIISHHKSKFLWNIVTQTRLQIFSHSTKVLNMSPDYVCMNWNSEFDFCLFRLSDKAVICQTQYLKLGAISCWADLCPFLLVLLPVDLKIHGQQITYCEHDAVHIFVYLSCKVLGIASSNVHILYYYTKCGWVVRGGGGGG